RAERLDLQRAVGEHHGFGLEAMLGPQALLFGDADEHGAVSVGDVADLDGFGLHGGARGLLTTRVGGGSLLVGGAGGERAHAEDPGGPDEHLTASESRHWFLLLVVERSGTGVVMTGGTPDP